MHIHASPPDSTSSSISIIHDQLSIQTLIIRLQTQMDGIAMLVMKDAKKLAATLMKGVMAVFLGYRSCS